MRDLEVVISELISTYEELAYAQAEDLRVRRDAYASSTEPSVAARDRVADWAGCDTRCTVLELQGRLSGLLTEKDFLLWEAEHRCR